MARRGDETSSTPPKWPDPLAGLAVVVHPPTDDEKAAGTRRFRYEDEAAHWAVEGICDDDIAEPRITALSITPLDGAAITAGLLKNIAIGKIGSVLQFVLMQERIKDGRAFLGIEPHGDLRPENIVVTSGNAEVRVIDVAPRKHTGGRTPMSDELLRAVAEAYLEETAPDKPPRPMARLAERFERPEETVRTWLARARKAGWLGPGIRGRIGGEPGPRLLAEYARMPYAERIDETHVSIVAAPPEGSESAEEAERRAMANWRRRVESGHGGPRPNSVDVTVSTGADAAEPPAE